MLLESPKLNPSGIDEELLDMPCFEGHTEVVKLLVNSDRVDAKANDYQYLRVAAQEGHQEIVRFFVEKFGPEAAEATYEDSEFEIQEMLRNYFANNNSFENLPK